jgi:hypothetical protein
MQGSDQRKAGKGDIALGPGEFFLAILIDSGRVKTVHQFDHSEFDFSFDPQAEIL